MSEPLVVYLHDHLAGSAFAIDLIDSMRDRYAGQPIGEFASGLLAEIKQDSEVLQQIADRCGKGSADVKQAAAWVAEKMTRFKLSHDEPLGLGTFQALETLALGILGKLALWRALSTIAATDDRLTGVDLEELSVRAQKQHAKVEEYRLRIARTALARAE